MRTGLILERPQSHKQERVEMAAAGVGRGGKKKKKKAALPLVAAVAAETPQRK